MTERFRQLVIFLLPLIAAGCASKGGSSEASPTAPTPVAAPTLPGAANAPVLAGVQVANFKHSVQIAWNPVADASTYELNINYRAPGVSVFTLRREVVTATSFSLTEGGLYSISVSTRNAAGLTPGRGAALFEVVDMQDATEALFFNAGPMGETEGGAAQPRYDRMHGWPTGATVPVTVGTNVPSSQHNIISRVTEQFQQGSGIYQMPIIPTPRIEPVFVRGEIHVINPPAEQRGTLCSNVGDRVIEGCSIPSVLPNGTTYQAVLVVVWANTPYLAAHEVSHAFGLFHVALPTAPSGTGDLIMRTPRPSPEPDQLSVIELEIIRTVYANGFRDGTPKQDFITRGLVKAH
jgi:hypothetical protein